MYLVRPLQTATIAIDVLCVGGVEHAGVGVPVPVKFAESNRSRFNMFQPLTL